MSKGLFVWHDLMTTDPSVAIPFYRDLLGWEMGETEFEGFGAYTVASVANKELGGFVPLDAAESLPSHWMPYISVDSVDAACAQLVELGGKVHTEPFSLPGIARIAVAADADGARFSPFQSLHPADGAELPQAGRQGGMASWHDVMADDVPRAVDFYTSIFGWNDVLWDMSGKAMHGMHVAEMPVAVLYERPPEVPDCSWTIYFEATAEMEDMLADVERLGGQVIVPKFTIESGGDFGIAMDPTGAVFGLIKSLSPDSAEPAAAS